jgi:four helix bundle protein
VHRLAGWSEIWAVDKQTGNRQQATGNREPQIRKGADIARRLLGFGVAVLHLGARLPRDAAGRHVFIQLVRSATSAGANYEEARAAESRADFVHKVGVAAKEMREAWYWVCLVGEAGWVKDVHPLRIEAGELAAILSASARTARQNRNAP